MIFKLILTMASIATLALATNCAKRGKHMPLDPQSISSPNGVKGPKPNPNPRPTEPGTCNNIIQYEVGYKEDILPIVEQKCKICHSVAPMDWTDYKTFSGAQAKVLDRVFVKQDMPMKNFPQLTTEEQEKLKTWLDIGTPEFKEVVDETLCPQNK